MVVSLLDAATRTAVEIRVRRLQPDSRRQWGRMTSHQAICHMSDAFRMALGDRDTAPVPASFKPLVRFVALRLPLRWPRGRIQTVPEVEQGVGGTPPIEFERDRAELIALMSRFGTAAPADRCSTHPIFGPMSADLWGRWGYRHMDHHLRQFGV
jgi:hypothetical protein